MSLIEGVGDEVTVLVSILLAIFIFIVAWFSTHIRDIPFFSVIVIELTQRNASSNQANTSAQAAPSLDSGATNSVDGQDTETDIVSPVQETCGPSDETSTNSKETSADCSSNGQQPELGSAEGILPGREVTPQGTDFIGKSSSDQQNHENKESLMSEQLQREEEMKESVVLKESVVCTASAANQEANQNSITQNVRGDNSDQQPLTGTGMSDEITESDSETTASLNVLPETVMESTLSSSELRKRRVAFFDRQTCSDEQNTSDSSLTVENSSQEKFVTESVGESLACIPEKLPSSDSDCGHDGDNNQTVLNSDSSSEPVSPVSDAASEAWSAESSTDMPAPNRGVEADAYVDIQDGQIRIRLKYLNETQRHVVASPTDTIDQFRRAHFAMELEENKLVRFIFNGQDLRNGTSTLQAYNIVDNSVIHCLITRVNTEADQHAHHLVDVGGFDIGVLMVPLFGIILLIIWYFRFTYRQYFNASSTLSLMGITFLFLAACFSTLRARVVRPHEHVE